jgi:hypothetical protein
MATILLKNTRKHDIHLNYVDPTGPKGPQADPNNELEEVFRKVPGKVAGALGRIVVPAAKANPDPKANNRAIHGVVEVDDRVLAELKKSPAINGFFADGWLLTEEKKSSAPALAAGDKVDPGGNKK